LIDAPSVWSGPSTFDGLGVGAGPASVPGAPASDEGDPPLPDPLPPPEPPELEPEAPPDPPELLPAAPPPLLEPVPLSAGLPEPPFTVVDGDPGSDVRVS
jgi:hypothetical protein